MDKPQLTPAQQAQLDRLVEGLKMDAYDDYHVRPIDDSKDSGLHAQGWQGRFMMLSGHVRLEIFGQTFHYAENEAYQVLPDTSHREVFGPGPNVLVIARKYTGKPLPEVNADFTVVPLR